METPLARVKALLAALPRPDQEDLARFLQDILVDPRAPGRHVATLQGARRRGGRPVTYTFRTEAVRCGRASCRCATGAGHGPYVYKYWREDGRLRKAYVGKATGGAAGGVTPPGGGGSAAPGRSGTGGSRRAPTPPG